jgi:uncharacterized repeat protein (TIGR02543 family)
MTAKFTYSITSNHTSWTFELSALDIEFSQSGSGTDLTKARSKRENAMQSGIPLKFYYRGSVVYSTTIEGTPDHPRPWMRPEVTRTVTKTHAAQTLVFYAEFNGKAGTKYTQTIPAKPSYKVTYNGNGATSPAAATKWYGEDLTLNAALTRTNYAFNRWNTNTSNTGTGYAAGAKYTGNAALTLYAIWNPYIYYNANGGSGGPGTVKKTFGVTHTVPTTKPTRSGYTFSHWCTNTSNTGTKYYSGSSTYTGNTTLTLYAIWKANITFNNNGGSGAPTGQTKPYGENYTIPSATMSRTGYSFWHWNTKADNSGTAYVSGDRYTTHAPLALYAIWNPTLTFHPNGGSGSTWTATKTYNSAYTPTKPTRANYQFLGWSTSATATTATYATTIPASVNTPTTFYAVWKRIYELPKLTVTDIHRADANGNEDDTGEYASITVAWTISQHTVSNNELVANSVVQNGITASCNGAFGSQSAEHAGDTSGTATFLLNANMATDTSYEATITLTDQGGTNTFAVTVPMAYFPLDIMSLDSGHGVAVGAPATIADTFEIGFEDTVFTLNTNEDLYTALDSLGWYNSVLHSIGGIPSLKKLFTKILQRMTTKNLTITRTANSYVDATSVALLKAVRKDGMLWFNGNIRLSSAVPTGTDLTEIAQISGWSSAYSISATMAGQNGGGAILVSINKSGSVQIANGSGASATGFHRCPMVVPAND